MPNRTSTAIAAAYFAGVDLRIQKTRTFNDEHGVQWLYLWGNAIARRIPGEGNFVTLGHHKLTKTTQDRFKALGLSVSTKKGELYLNGDPWNGEWTRVTITRKSIQEACHG